MLWVCVCTIFVYKQELGSRNSVHNCNFVWFTWDQVVLSHIVQWVTFWDLAWSILYCIISASVLITCSISFNPFMSVAFWSRFSKVHDDASIFWNIDVNFYFVRICKIYTAICNAVLVQLQYMLYLCVCLSICYNYCSAKIVTCKQ